LGAETGSGARVLVVDDDMHCRALVRELLERIGCIATEAASGNEALAAAEAELPDLVLLEIAIPGITGYEVCRELRDRFGAALPIVFLSGTRVEALDRVGGLLIGADDYVVKPFDPDELLGRVRALLRSRNGRRPTPRVASPIEELTSREREVLTLLARGRNQREIAAELVISSTTVGTHIQRVLSKLGLHSRTQAVALAHRERLVYDVEAHVQLVR
jgi:two-component system nitrate/nitrite response regulator NarL